MVAVSLTRVRFDVTRPLLSIAMTTARLHSDVRTFRPRHRAARRSSAVLYFTALASAAAAAGKRQIMDALDRLFS